MQNHATDSSIESAIETFIGGFSFTRSFTHPCLGEKVGPLWVIRDGPRKRPAYRTEEWVSHGTPAAEVDRIARAGTRGRFAVGAIVGNGEPVDRVRDDFKSIGYRLGTTEPLMVHDRARIPRCDSPAAIERVLSPELADLLHTTTKSRQILPAHFPADSRLRSYVALIDGQPAGWVRSIAVGRSTWCSNMHVLPAHRRQGIARALLSRMLTDDRRRGATSAVLLASHVGAKLYPVVGYRQIGTLLLLTPKRRT
jgi:GNAT superfamily N-acetyltransferase